MIWTLATRMGFASEQWKTGGGRTPRVYPVPKEIVNDTTLTIALRVIHNDGAGGIWGGGVKMRIHPDSSRDAAECVLFPEIGSISPLLNTWEANFISTKPRGKNFIRGPNLK